MTTPQPALDPPKLTLLDLISFVAGLALMYFLGWSTKDLVWGFWFTSFATGFVFELTRLIQGTSKLQITSIGWILVAIGITLGMGMFAVHFGMFHYVYASILDLPMPLMEHPGRVYIGHLTWSGGTRFSFFETLGIAALNYWPFALISIAHSYRSFFQQSGDDKWFEPYKNVLRMHFLIFVLMPLYALGLESFLAFTLIYVIYFAPKGFWGAIIFRKQKSDLPKVPNVSS